MSYTCHIYLPPPAFRTPKSATQACNKLHSPKAAPPALTHSHPKKQGNQTGKPPPPTRLQRKTQQVTTPSFPLSPTRFAVSSSIARLAQPVRKTSLREAPFAPLQRPIRIVRPCGHPRLRVIAMREVEEREHAFGMLVACIGWC